MREKEFDILKGIGILLVVIGHTGIWGLPRTYIYAFHMPLFFFVSGCFYKRRPFVVFLKRKAKSLLLPWICFAMLFFIATTCIDAIKMQNVPEALSVNLNALNLMDEHCRTLFHSIWFLVCLFEVSVFYALLDRMPSYLKWGGVIVCWILGSYGSSRVDMPLFLDTAMSSLLYYHFGYEFFNSDWPHKKMNGAIPWLLIVILSVVIVIIRPDVSLFSNKYPVYLPIISIPFVVSLYYIVKQIAPFLPDILVKSFSLLGRDSLLILGFHRFLFIILEFILPLVGLTGLLAFGIKFLLAFPFIYAVKIPVEKHLPFIIGKTKKLK